MGLSLWLFSLICSNRTSEVPLEVTLSFFGAYVILGGAYVILGGHEEGSFAFDYVYYMTVAIDHSCIMARLMLR
jgi:hypothetical protein